MTESLFREILSKIEDENAKRRAKIREIEILTANMNMVRYINTNYRQTLMDDNDKENAEPSPPPQPKPQKAKKEANSWDCPKIEYIPQESYDQLNRHQRGSLKYAHLNQATDEVSFKATQRKKIISPFRLTK